MPHDTYHLKKVTRPTIDSIAHDLDDPGFAESTLRRLTQANSDLAVGSLAAAKHSAETGTSADKAFMQGVYFVIGSLLRTKDDEMLYSLLNASGEGDSQSSTQKIDPDVPGSIHEDRNDAA